MLIIDAHDLSALVQKISLRAFLDQLVTCMKHDFMHAHEFHQCPRVSFKHPEGILELMPVFNQDFFANKYVCTHKDNHHKNHYVVMGQGLWVDAHTGQPLMITEMTILTAIRTAAVSLMMSELMLKPNCQSMAIIGCGAQSDFQVMAHQKFGFNDIRCFDVDKHAMNRLINQMAKEGISIKPCESVEAAVRDVDFIITLTNANRTYPLIREEWLKNGVHINAMGGDAPGSSELDSSIVKNSDIIVVEYLEQTKLEGETQQLVESGNMEHVVEIAEFLKSKFNPNLIRHSSIFDGVGIALLDYSAMRLVWKLCHEHHIGHQIKMLPTYRGDKNLYQFLSLNRD